MKRKPVLTVNHSPREKLYLLLHRSPQLPGDPEFAVARDGQTAEVIAHFFSQQDALDYAQWKSDGH